MKYSSMSLPVLTAGILCTAFALTACGNNGDAPLPSRDSAEGHALYEQCLKTLPPEQAAELRQVREEFYFSTMARHDDLLNVCRKINAGQSPAP